MCNPRLVDAAKAEESSFDELYRRYLVMVRGRALRICGEIGTAEDIAQEVFLKFIEHRGRGGTEQETAAFLYRMTTNLALNRIRDAKRRRALLSQNTSFDRSGEGAPEDRIALQRVLSAVGDEEGTIAIYYYVDGMEQEEIAALLSMERRTVGRRLERFRERAKKVLATAGGAQ